MMAHTPASVSTERRLSVSPASSFWCSDQTIADPQHLHPDQEGSAASLPPEETKEGPSVSSDSGEPLPLLLIYF